MKPVFLRNAQGRPCICKSPLIGSLYLAVPPERTIDNRVLCESEVVSRHLTDTKMMRTKSQSPSFISCAFFICSLGLAALPMAGCGRETEGRVEIKDKSYSYSVYATDKDGFDAPDGLLWREGKLYIADEGGPAFRIWRKEGVRTLSTAADGIESPEDFVVDTDGSIYFTDDDAGGVWKIDTEGKTAVLAGKQKGLVSTEGIAMSQSGDLLVGEGASGRIFAVTRKGVVSVFLGAEGGVRKPESMAYDETGNLFVADNEERVLYLLSPEKKLRALVRDREGFSPESISYADGGLYITDSDHGRLFRYDDKSGLREIAEMSGIYFKAAGVTTDRAGNIFVSIQTHIDDKHSYILKFTKN